MIDLLAFFSEYKHLFEIEIFCDIRNVFAVTFDQFNASLLNKNMNFFNQKKKICN